MSKISATCIVSNAEWGCYPFIESIKSFLPACDEMVVVYNAYPIDNTNEILRKEFGNKIRMIPSLFDLENVGWLSYGVARTVGYQACTGDVVLTFDIDGILHENSVDRVRQLAEEMVRDGVKKAHWMKYRMYKLGWAYQQGKHLGIYNKALVKDNVHFYHEDRRGIETIRPGFDMGKHRQWDVFLYGYEHFWDTEEVIRAKAERYNRMIAKAAGNEPIEKGIFWKQYLDDMRVSKKPKVDMPIENHPKIIQEKLKGLNEKHFAYNWFGN